MTTEFSDTVYEPVSCTPGDSSSARSPGECVMLHLPATFPMAGQAGGRASGGAAGNDRLTADAPPPFDVVTTGPGAFAFSGSRSGRIVMSVGADGQASFSHQGVRAARTVRLDREQAMEIRLLALERLAVAARDLQGWRVSFTGTGLVNITGVCVASAAFDGTRVLGAHAKPDISAVLRGAGNLDLLRVNGSVADLIKSTWVYLEQEGREQDAAQGRQYTQMIAKIELALMYVEYLKGGGMPFDRFIADIQLDAAGRVAGCQSLHDNLLGELSETMLRRRLVQNPPPVPAELSLTREGLYQAYMGLAGELAARPYFTGRNPNENDADCATVAFDFKAGWERAQYVRRIPDGRLTRAAVNDDEQMWGGSGGPVTGFSIARHEGVGIELALKARKSQGGDCESQVHEQPGPVLYRADVGEDPQRKHWGISARWFVDFSVSTRLMGVERLLDDFRFVLSVDTSTAADPPCFCRFLLTRPGSLYHPAIGEIDVGRAWLLVGEGDGILLRDDGTVSGGFGDDIDESVSSFVSQNAVNFGLHFMRRLLGDYARSDSPQPFGPGMFDIRLEAFDDGGTLLLDNHIQVQVG